MNDITYKYKIGDTVNLKPENYFETEVMGTKVIVTSAEIVDRRDYDGPCYALGGCAGFWREGCFTGLYKEH